MGGEGKEKIYCFGVDCGGEDVAETVRSFLIAEDHQATFVFGGVPHCVEFEFEVHFCGYHLISATGARVDGDFVEGGFLEAIEVPEHVELFENGFAPVRPVLLAFCLSESWIRAGSGAPGSDKCKCFQALGEVRDGAAGGRFDCFW